jgi:hypothetical protein
VVVAGNRFKKHLHLQPLAKPRLQNAEKIAKQNQ